jgi:ABC-type spermidine/putrescine transport system permease subunit II
VPLRVLSVAVLLALAVRLLYLALAPPPPVHSDASGYDAAARRLIATGSYAFPVGKALWSHDVFAEDAWPAFERMPANAWSMPGYPVFLAAVYRWSGVGPGRFAAVRIAQALLGAITAGLVFLLADALLGRRPAWVAFALNALYPAGLWATQYLLTEILFTLLMVGPIANSLAKIDPALIEAARDAGAGRWQVMVEVIIPLSKTGIALGSILVFTQVMGDFFVVKAMSGGQSASIVSALATEIQAMQYPPAAASAVVLVSFVALLVAGMMRVVDVRKELVK